jgi:hypothetical protein
MNVRGTNHLQSLVIGNTIHLQYMEVSSQQRGELGGRPFVAHKGKYLIFWISTLFHGISLNLSGMSIITPH